MKHIPVMLEEVLSYLAIEPGMTVVDATLGSGGYSREIERRISPAGTLIAIDRDAEAVGRYLKMREEFARPDVNVIAVHANYSEIREILHDHGVNGVEAIVADLGWSSDQMADPKKGMSIRESAPLDMRLDAMQDVLTAKDVVNTYSQEDLAHIFREYGDELHARRIAGAIVGHREKQPIETTGDLVNLIVSIVRKKGMRIHPATRVFQALRIEVNREFEHLEKFLEDGISCLNPYGKMAVVSFHSGEDRRVKQVFRENARGCICPEAFPVCQCDHVPEATILTRKAVTPGEKEIRNNPASRSAKLRAVQKIPKK